ncbi:MAG: YicC/YloC family endoribonuclease [Pseudomonadota bacterium]
MGEATPTLASMTGYASLSGAHGDTRWTFEARSVNGRGLDIKLRLPSGWDALDPIIKKIFRDHLVRGNLSISAQIEVEHEATGLSLNAPLVQQLTELAHQATSITGQPVTLDNILSIRGVLEDKTSHDISDEFVAAVQPAITADITTLAQALVAAREQEGAAMAVVLHGHADSLARLTQEADALAASIPTALRDKLTTTIAELQRDSEVEFPEERLAQEVLVLASKADIREEIDRLRAHVDSLKDLLAEGRGVGRRLDFLAQEFNREANTLCSKSTSTDLTRVGMALKTVIDQLREQVQNIE